LRFGGALDENGPVCIGPNPKVAPKYFLFRIFQPAESDWLVRRRDYEIPIEYLRFLATANGCFAYEMSLFGFTPTMERTGLLSRTMVQCHDLTTANQIWRIGYPVSETALYFGCRQYSHSANVGYFMEDSGSIRAVLKSGLVVGQWGEFGTFLRDELAAAEIYNAPKNPR
jgi:hypothetical protein